MRLIDLMACGLRTPVVNRGDTILSFAIEAEESPALAASFRITAADSAKALENEEYNCWDSGMVSYTGLCSILYAGRRLSHGERVYWKAELLDENENTLSISDISWFEEGLSASDWKGFWIGDGEKQQEAASYLAGSFYISKEYFPTEGRAYVCGLGLCDVYVNGKLVSESFFGPGEADWSRTCYAEAYDITPFLQSGENVLGLVLGNGQYTGYHINPVMKLPDGTESPLHRYQKNDSCCEKAGLFGTKKAIAQVEIRKDGAFETVLVTDERFFCGQGPVTFQNWYGGEDYDTHKEIPGWNTPGNQTVLHRHAVRVAAPEGVLTMRTYPQITCCETLVPVSVLCTGRDSYLIDFGKNSAGVPELRLYGQDEKRTGKTIRLLPGELTDESGQHVDQRSSTQSWSETYHCRIEDRYTCAGAGPVCWHPRFVYHGFRYLEVQGFPGEAGTENFRLLRVRAACEKTGSFTSDDPTLNAICAITDRSIESNMMYSFTDCPQIEKLGWIETSHLMFGSLASGYDIRAWMHKIIHDIGDAQITEHDRQNGETEDIGFVPGIIPEYYRIGGLYRDLNWNGACVFTPWEFYRWYGDRSILRKAFPVMERYLAYLDRQAGSGLLVDYGQMGEWGEYGDTTPEMFVTNSAWHRMLKIAANVAGILEQPLKQTFYEERAREIRHLIHASSVCFDSETGVYGSGSESSLAIALFSGLVSQVREKAVLQDLVCRIEKQGDHLTGGEVGLRQIFAVLSAHDRDDVVWRMVTNETAPSYKVFVKAGMTTLPEYWNCDDLWHGMVRSRNHAMMGHVREWLVTGILGIKRITDNWSEVRIVPYAPPELSTASGHVQTPLGRLSVSWEKKESGIFITADVPVGITVQVRLENGSQKGFMTGGKRYEWMQTLTGDM